MYKLLSLAVRGRLALELYVDVRGFYFVWDRSEASGLMQDLVGCEGTGTRNDVGVYR